MRSYEEEYWYFEAIWLFHKFYFTGLLPIIEPGTPVQVCAGAFGSAIAFTVCMHTMPYKSLICDLVQVCVRRLQPGTRRPVRKHSSADTAPTGCGARSSLR